ncbi:unnamed protein product [Linum tenue]|uniref:Uncharacterized protein n=1 Tax=Linum tenue TaxID=586396 RepID=A0AAV0PZR2_9ROSI|nr:unnamed protein product [Linum tenue]
MTSCQWLCCCLRSHNGSCLEHERIGLLELKSSLNDPLSGHWNGVRCNPTIGKVTKLSLSNSNYANSSTRPNLNTSLFLPFQDYLRVLTVHNILGCMENEGWAPGLERLEIDDSIIVACNTFLEILGTKMTNLTFLTIHGGSSLSSTIPQDFNMKGAVGFPWWLLANNTYLQFLDSPTVHFQGIFSCRRSPIIDTTEFMEI